MAGRYGVHRVCRGSGRAFWAVLSSSTPPEYPPDGSVGTQPIVEALQTTWESPRSNSPYTGDVAPPGTPLGGHMYGTISCQKSNFGGFRVFLPHQSAPLMGQQAYNPLWRPYKSSITKSPYTGYVRTSATVRREEGLCLVLLPLKSSDPPPMGSAWCSCL